MKKIKIEIKWAIIFAVSSLLWMILEKSMGLHDEYIQDHAKHTMLFSIIALAIFIIAVFDKRKNSYDGYITWKQGFFSGLLITAILVIISPLLQWITAAYISPDYYANAIELAVETGKLTQEKAEAYFNLPSYIKQAMIGTAVMGIGTSLITATLGLIGRKKNG
jgi:hypothetical protein